MCYYYYTDMQGSLGFPTLIFCLLNDFLQFPPPWLTTIYPHDIQLSALYFLWCPFVFLAHYHGFPLFFSRSSVPVPSWVWESEARSYFSWTNYLPPIMIGDSWAELSFPHLPVFRTSIDLSREREREREELTCCLTSTGAGSIKTLKGPKAWQYWVMGFCSLPKC
jgi:hypothetical protein